MNQNKDTLRENSLALIAKWRDELGSEVEDEFKPVNNENKIEELMVNKKINNQLKFK